jgi:hypothetical protein
VTLLLQRAGRRIRRCAALTLLLAVASLAPPLSSPAAAQQLDQLQLAGGGRADAGRGIAVDAAGNRYLTGSFESQATFGTGGGAPRLSSRGVDDAFVARYDPAGAIVWARQIGGQLSDSGRGIAVAGDGSVYVTGLFAAVARFDDPVTRRSAGQSDAFVAKYSAGGQLEWAARAGGAATDSGFGVAVAGDEIVVAGLFSGAASFEHGDGSLAATLQSAGGSDSFVARYSADGRLLWARAAGGSGNDAARAVAVDGAGDAYVTGSFRDAATFASPGATGQLTSAGSEDLFVARYSPAGELRWARSAGGAGVDRGFAIALDGARSSYITGFFSGAATFGGEALAGAGAEIFLAKLDADGAIVGAVGAGGPGTDEGRGIALAPDGTILLTGTFVDTAIFGGGLRELRQRDRGSITNKGIFVAAFNPALQPIFLESAGRESNSFEQAGNAVAADSAGRAHVTGIVQDLAVFGMGSDITTRKVNGRGDLFLATFAAGTPREVFYISSSSGGSVDGINFADEDVLAYDLANNRWSVLIDGSDIGLAGTDINAFEWRSDGSLFMSFNTPVTLPGIAFEVDDSDIVRFIPERLGATTAGRFELFFDGSDVGLTLATENIDAVGFQPDGRLAISTGGAASAPGVAGTVNAAGADILLFSGEGFGEATRGSWERLFEGAVSQLGDSPGEGLAALWFAPDGEFVIGVGGTFAAVGRDNFGDAAEVFRCTRFTIDGKLACGFFPFLMGGAAGLRGEVVDAFSVGNSGVLGEIGEGDEVEAGPPDEDEHDLPRLVQPGEIYLPLLATGS